ncbi:reverse transcriptase domain-containing protein [Tanacetum coccineum]
MSLNAKPLPDLGASLTLMPFSVYTKLGLPALQSTRMTLELANCSLCVPKGIARDVLVPVGRLTFPADFVVVDFECDYRVPLILGRPFLRTARVLIDVHGEELVIRDGMERIVFKPDGSQDKESIHMMDIYDDRFKDVCEPESNDSSSPTSTIVEEFDSLVGEIIKQKEEVKEISDPVARRRACFAKLENFRIIHQGRVIHSPKIASVSAISHIFPNNNLEDSFKMGDEDLNFIPNKELDKEDLIPIPRESKIGKECDFPFCDDFQNDEEIISIEVSRQISPKVDVKTILSFFAPIGNCVRKWATNEFVKDNDEINHEVFKSDNENVLGVHDNEEEEIAFLRKTKEDFETKVEPKSKKELQVVHPDIEILNHFETTSYVGSDYVFYEDFNLVDMIFPMNIQGKIFDPGITFHEKSFEKDAFKDKSSKELAPSKSLLTLDVFDPLHPPLMDFHVTKAFSGFTFSLLKIFSKKFFEPGIKNATVYLSYLVWGGFPDFGKDSMVSILWKKQKAMPTNFMIDIKSSLHKRKDIKVKNEQKPTRNEETSDQEKDLKPISKAGSRPWSRKDKKCLHTHTTDHAGCIDTRKSTSGGRQFLSDKLVSWMSKKQNCTVMSSAEAEYVALSASCAQVMWMRTASDYASLQTKSVVLRLLSQP